MPQTTVTAVEDLAETSEIRGVKSITATATVGSGGVFLVDATGGAVTLTLPLAAAIIGRVISVKKIDASGNAVTVDGSGSETIDGASTAVLTSQYDSVTVMTDGSEWFTI